MTNSVLTKSDMAVALRFVSANTDNIRLSRRIEATARFALDALEVMFKGRDSSYFLYAYVSAWVRAGIELAGEEHIVSIAGADADEVFDAFAEHAWAITDNDFFVLEAAKSEMDMLNSVYDEFGKSDMLDEQLGATCYRMCEAAFLATRKPKIIETLITADN